MGFFDGWDGASVISGKSSRKHHHHKSSSSHKHKRSRSRSRSRHRHSKSANHLGDFFGFDQHSSHYNKHNASRGSFFNLGNSSSRSFFGLAQAAASRPHLLCQEAPHEGLHASHHAPHHGRRAHRPPGPLRAPPAAGPRAHARHCRQDGYRTFNLGAGQGNTVMEVVRAMEAASGRSIPYEIVDRRAGDVEYSVAAVGRAYKELGWETKETLDTACRDICNRLGLYN
ncbi:hypothetical protein G7054_g12911 [Neopestalotiopsis clavispora]|nr:hypothetical protein G7054_g12911 [Neopestalotiopsis clavispora]